MIADPGFGEAPITTTIDASYSLDIDGEIVSYEWEIEGGNGPYGNVEQVTASFPEPGNYWVRLTVTDDEGLSKTGELLLVILQPGLLSGGGL